MRTKPIYANRFWNDTDVDLVEGFAYRFSVAPGIGEPLMDASYVARTIEGEDWESLPHRTANLLHGKRMNDAKWFALIGTVDRKHPWIVRDGGVMTAPASGRLFCYFNDAQLDVFYKNNKGWVELDIELLPK